MTDTTYLERALIGALLNEPRSGSGLPTLTRRDFTDPLCRALWTVLTTETSWRPGPVNVTDITERLTSLGAELHPTLRSAAAVADVQVQAPARPHPVAYARLIMDETVRRDVLALGYQLTRIDPAQPEQAITTIDAITAQLQAHRAQSALGPATPLGEHDSRAIRPDAGAARTDGEDGEQQRRAEYAVLGAAIHDHPPGSRAHVQACITMNDLSRPDIRTAWTAINQLQTAGLPVDEITVYWQLTHSAIAIRRMPTIAMLRDSRDASALHHEALRTLTAASTIRALTRLRTTTKALQTDPRPLPETIDAITSSTEEVRHQVHRVDALGATGRPTPSRRPGPATH